MTRRLIGYDVTGWRDTAVRNWLAQPGDGEDAFGEFPISGGLGSVIHPDAERPDHWIGGVTAQLAPHGRGGGWGDVGRPEARQAVRDLVDAPADHVEALSATLRAMGGKAEIAVVAIDDAPANHDMVFDGWITAMRKAGHRRGLHVWRPILTVLSAIQRGLLQSTGEVTIISQGANGLFLQTLRIRSEDDVLAPERRVQGEFFPSSSGFQHLRTQAEHHLKQTILSERDHSILRSALSPDWFALGLASEPELVRTANGGWKPLPKLPSLPPPTCDLPHEFILTLGRDRSVLLETVAEGAVRAAFIDSIRKHCAIEPHIGDPDAVAHGAFIAAERASAGIPIYYDFLPQISTIVQPRNRDPESVDLIPKGAMLPAGQVYRSAQPARFGLQARKKEIEIYLKKEGEHQPRHAIVPVSPSTSASEPIELIVEQAPAEGRARLVLSSKAMAVPASVDWGRSTPLEEETWEEIVERLARHARPTIPKRVILPAGHACWYGTGNYQGLSGLLSRQANTGEFDWKKLAGRFSGKMLGAHPISSDGELPDEIRGVDAANFEMLFNDALNDVMSRLNRASTNQTNDSLRFLTWTFKRCPQRIIQELLSALPAADGNNRHIFVPTLSSARLIYQGIGRTVDRKQDIRTVLDHVAKLPDSTLRPMNHIACLAFLMSRSEQGPHVIERHEVDRLARIGISALKRMDPRRPGTTGIHYPPFLLLGLVRYREEDPHALVAGRSDETADAMLTATEQEIPRYFRERHLGNRNRILARALLELRAQLKGRGHNQNILTELASMG